MEDIRIGWGVIQELIFRLDATSSGQIPVVISSKHDNEPSNSIECRECIDQMTDFYLSK